MVFGLRDDIPPFPTVPLVLRCLHLKENIKLLSGFGLLGSVVFFRHGFGHGMGWDGIDLEVKVEVDEEQKQNRGIPRVGK